MKLWIPVEDETLKYEYDMTNLEGREKAEFDHWESILLSYKDITRQIKLPTSGNQPLVSGLADIDWTDLNTVDYQDR